MHAVLIGLAVVAVDALQASQPQVYVVNLVPAVAAVGSPHGRASVPLAPRPPAPAPVARPPAPAPVAPRPPAPAPEPPAREVAPADLPPPALPPRDLPPRELPARTALAEPIRLPEHALPARTAATPTPPRARDKELPAIASAKSPTPVAPAAFPPPPAPASIPASPALTPPPATAAMPPAAVASPAPPEPPQPLGQPTGSPAGKGKLTLEVDFPFALYLRALVNKIDERWDGRALPGHQPLVVFEIDRSGTVNPGKIRIDRSSGNSAYDRVALRTIAESTPFPPLPPEFKGSHLRIFLQFDYNLGG
jgi:TonB family protein